jgi:hypothetical protein
MQCLDRDKSHKLCGCDRKTCERTGRDVRCKHPEDMVFFDNKSNYVCLLCAEKIIKE